MFCIWEETIRKIANQVPIQPGAIASRRISSQNEVQRSFWLAKYRNQDGTIASVTRIAKPKTSQKMPALVQVHSQSRMSSPPRRKAGFSLFSSFGGSGRLMRTHPC